ncbi:helicase associated domain-containing protein [Tersicoccus sp. MR15.9]|uniref:helicase associated domain-containing protein n=1 Tax=Tersicoccus mangrovi TaxID=3121635 RepID=UPI002FE6B746
MDLDARPDDRDQLDHLCDFVTAHARWPSPASGPGPERLLGRWLARQRVAAAAGTMDPFRRAALDTLTPGWDPGPQERWLETARTVSDQILATGTVPGYGQGETAESVLGLWLRTQRTLAAAGSLSAGRRDWLDAHCPGWDRPPAAHPKTVTERPRTA